MGAANPVPTVTLGSRQLICDVEMTLVTTVSSVETMGYLRIDGELSVDVTDFQSNLVLYPCIHFVVCSLLRILSLSKHCEGVVEETTTVALKLEAKNHTALVTARTSGQERKCSTTTQPISVLAPHTVNSASAALSIQSHRAASFNSVTQVAELRKELV